MSKKVFQKIARGLIVVALLLSATNLTVFAQETPPPIPTVEYFIVETKVLDDGTSIDKILINGPPTPPVGYERTTVELPEPNPEAGLVTLSVPAYNWSFGCSATSASMIAAFYDRGSYPGMYTGPTNNGTMPMNNSTWEDVIIAGETRHQCPLSATRNGLDGRTIRGHVDDYWIQYGATGPDPYDGNWTEHTLGDCTGDYMKTNKWFASKIFNTDGGTTFYNYTNGAPITAAALESHGVDIYDGGYGLKLFYESRGETVDAMYNQYIYGYVGDQGFTYDQYKAEIDADRPVMIHLEGHTVVGVGYDDSSSDLMYINDTWDYTTHPMIWGSTYSGMNHMGVTIVRLGDPTLVNLARFDATPQGRAVHVEWETSAEIDNAGFHLWRSKTEDREYTRITDNLIAAQGGATFGVIYSYEDYDVIFGKTYYYKLEDIDYNGVSTFHGPVSVTAGDAAIMLITPEDGEPVSLICKYLLEELLPSIKPLYIFTFSPSLAGNMIEPLPLPANNCKSISCLQIS